VNGDVFIGTFTNVGGTETITWTHRGPGFTLETDATPVHDPEFPDHPSIICRVNGGEIAEVFSFGTAVVNGTPGYSYSILVDDNGPPPPDDFIPVCARLIQDPVRERSDSVLAFESPRTVIIPAELPVLKGNAGTGSARLRLDNHNCRYSGDGSGGSYLFERCTGPGGKDLVPGDALDVTQVQLRIQSADRSAPVTYVQANIGTNDDLFTLDEYSIYIAPPGSDVPTFSASGRVFCGHVEVVLDP
jgi:hypothetical protein